LRILETQGIGKILKDRVFWEDEKRILKSLEFQLNAEIEKRQKDPNKYKFKFEISKLDNLDILPNKEQISECVMILSRSMSELDKLFDDEMEILKRSLTEITETCQDWGQKYKQNEEELRASLIRVEDESGYSVKDYQDYLRLEQRKKELEELAANVEVKSDELIRAKAERSIQLKEFDKIKHEIFSIRNSMIKKINESLNGFVRIKIEKNADNSLYKEYLVTEILSNQKVRKDQRERVANSINPTDLADLLDKEDFKSLASSADISEKAANNVIELAKNKLYKIQVTELEDKITIELNDHGWKQISSCSDGQKCTAVLSIAMFERDIPLIIDQPEDSLDNSFIYKEVVKIIRRLKNTRQFIVATHNANIPVLGDSELMLVMTSNGTNGFVTERGVIDKDAIKIHVQNILEGGKDAFEKRKLKYGI